MGNYFIDSHMIGKSIKNLRLKCHLTQDDLADLVGYSVRHIRRIENNGTSNIDVVNTFAAIFKVAAIDILNGCFLLKIKKDIAGLHHTILTLICFSYTCTLGWTMSSDLIASRMGVWAEPWKELNYPSTFKERQHFKVNIYILICSKRLFSYSCLSNQL